MLLVRTAQVSIVVSGDDARRTRVDTVYPPVAGANVSTTDGFVDPSKEFNTPNYFVKCQFVRFDTGSYIPSDATVVSATLALYAGGVTNPDTRDVNFEWYPWTPPLVDGDFAALVGTTANVTALSALPSSNVTYTFALSDPDANIAKGPGAAFTGIRFGISGGAPTGVNQKFFYSWDHATNPAPSLIVDYEYTTFTIEPIFPKPILRAPVPVRW